MHEEPFDEVFDLLVADVLQAADVFHVQFFEARDCCGEAVR